MISCWGFLALDPGIELAVGVLGGQQCPRAYKSINRAKLIQTLPVTLLAHRRVKSLHTSSTDSPYHSTPVIFVTVFLPCLVSKTIITFFGLPSRNKGSCPGRLIMCMRCICSKNLGTQATLLGLISLQYSPFTLVGSPL